jgi:uncharacterized protein
MRSWTDCIGFDWDAGNCDKNWEKHRVSDPESEEVLFNRPLIVRHDPAHSDEERRFYALGEAHTGRRLFVAFTVRRNVIRVISAREMTRRERRFYHRYEQTEET